MRLLLLSNSTNPGESFLEYPENEIKSFLGEKKVNALFIPYAAVSFSFEEYLEKVKVRFQDFGHSVESIHNFSDPVDAVRKAEAIVVGGGNTWQLVRYLHDFGLMEVIKEQVKKGIPYIGWSAGSNVACPTLKTTNDMPIIDPKGFDCIGLVPFQINPHYLDAHPENHGGETREQRINEFLEINPEVNVVGLREGTILMREGDELRLLGSRDARLFRKGAAPRELEEAEELDFLLKE